MHLKMNENGGSEPLIFYKLYLSWYETGVSLGFTQEGVQKYSNRAHFYERRHFLIWKDEKQNHTSFENFQFLL